MLIFSAQDVGARGVTTRSIATRYTFRASRTSHTRIVLNMLIYGAQDGGARGVTIHSSIVTRCILHASRTSHTHLVLNMLIFGANYRVLTITSNVASTNTIATAIPCNPFNRTISTIEFAIASMHVRSRGADDTSFR
jgi:hypothetical protein